MLFFIFSWTPKLELFLICCLTFSYVPYLFCFLLIEFNFEFLDFFLSKVTRKTPQIIGFLSSNIFEWCYEITIMYYNLKNCWKSSHVIDFYDEKTISMLKFPLLVWDILFGNKLGIYFKAFLSVSKESLWILENPKLHISMRVGTPAELSVKQSIWKNGKFERNIQINILFF